MWIKIYISIILFFVYNAFVLYGNKNIMELGNELNYKNVKFIKNETFEKIKNIFTGKEFSEEFKYMDLKKNTYYIENYLEVLKMKKGYIAGTREEILNEEESKNRVELVYYFFDMNSDKIPELIIDNSPYTVDIFTFEINSKKVKRIVSLSSGTEFLGGNKIYQQYGGIGEYEHYLSLDSNGNFISESIFYSGSYPNENNLEEDKILYTIGCGDYTKQFNKLTNLAKNENEIIYYNNFRGGYFLRVTEEQSNELMKPYLEIRKKAEENIKRVTYTYDEIFGELEKSKELILDISSWSHPTKDVFKKYGITVNKVKLIDNFPTFYITFNRKYTNKEIDKLLNELLKANGYWNFEIKDELTEKSIKIYGDKKNKKLLKYEYE